MDRYMEQIDKCRSACWSRLMAIKQHTTMLDVNRSNKFRQPSSSQDRDKRRITFERCAEMINNMPLVRHVSG